MKRDETWHGDIKLTTDHTYYSNTSEWTEYKITSAKGVLLRFRIYNDGRRLDVLK